VNTSTFLKINELITVRLKFEKHIEKAPFLSYGHPSPVGGKLRVSGNEVTFPLRGTRSKAESRGENRSKELKADS